MGLSAHQAPSKISRFHAPHVVCNPFRINLLVDTQDTNPHTTASPSGEMLFHKPEEMSMNKARALSRATPVVHTQHTRRPVDKLSSGMLVVQGGAIARVKKLERMLGGLCVWSLEPFSGQLKSDRLIGSSATQVEIILPLY